MNVNLNENDVIEYLSNMKVCDAWDFAMKFGKSLGMCEEEVKNFLSPSAAVVSSGDTQGAQGGGSNNASAEEDSRSEFNVVLKSANDKKKIDAIKILRTYFSSISLKDAKTHVESAISGKSVDLGILEAEKFKKLEKDLAIGTPDEIANIVKE